jgi:inositol-phosphate phosphatase/L-galactose 1-phosphate phosphatase/histidinol-phosphatase
MEHCPKEYVEFAHRLADAAGEIQRRHFRQPVEVMLKPDGSPVTQVDKETERVLRELIERSYPDHGILGEEYPPMRAGAEFTWVLDPLDGTKSFLAGMPVFGILIGLAHAGEFVLGVIDQPILRDRWLGADGRGTIFNGARVHTRQCAALADAIVFLGKPYDAKIARLRPEVKWARYGGDCYGYGLLASGFVDGVVDAGLNDHDFVALEPVVRNAGGAVTDWQGQALKLGSSGQVVATGDPRLLEQVLQHFGRLS